VLSQKSTYFLIALFLFTLVITGCDSVLPGGNYVWIDVPRDGHIYPELQPVIVEGHATGPEGITRIELYVDGDLWRGVDEPEMKDDLALFEIEWLPPDLGEYTLQAVAYGPGGEASQYDQTTISFGGETATPTPVISVTPVISITPTLTDTPTPLPPAGPNVKFWADPETIDAGNCTDIHWQVENVQSVVFGGVEQPLEGVFQACLCKGETYTLTVTDLEGVVEKYRVNINVIGSCKDTQPPPAPVGSSPANGASLSCKSSQGISWSAVSDESGISQYRLQVERHSGDNNWKAVPGSVFTGITGTSKNVPVDCGWYFRWRVLAVDGEGNKSPWSSWWKFVVNLN